MKPDSQLVILDNQPSRNRIVLTIAAPAQNSITQVYPERIQVTKQSIIDLHVKLENKLRLHHIDDISEEFSIQFEKDRTVSLESVEAFQNYDLNIARETQVLTGKWSFVFDAEGHEPQLHSVFVRIAERAHPGLMFQRLLTGKVDDLADGEAFAPVFCKVDFLESRFSTELLAVVHEWVEAAPRPEALFSIASRVRRHLSVIQEVIFSTFPPVMMLAFLAIWVSFLPDKVTTSVKYAVVWIVLSGVVLLCARWIASRMCRLLDRHLNRVCTVPVFRITAGDEQRVGRFVAKSHRSALALIGSGVLYGVAKAIGLYFGGVLIAKLII